MDITPIHQDVSEDSGCLTGTDNSSSVVDVTANHASFVETPTTSFPSSRKRKIFHLLESFNHKTIEVPGFESVPACLNDSLPRKFERCNLEEYKTYKKNRTQTSPSTPVKEIKAVKTFLPIKRGSPERLELLYPTLKQVPEQYKPRSPQKFKELLKKLRSPAKKRLFETNRDIKKDPINLFFSKSGHLGVVSKIFSNLCDSDLYSVSMVSKCWRQALYCDRKSFERYSRFLERFRSNKENLVRTPSFEGPISPPDSPGKGIFHQCVKLARNLRADQSLNKCPKCNHISIVNRNVVKCTNLNCEYIYCRSCMSCSTSGPEGFIDNCKKSKLVVVDPKSGNRPGLCDISNVGSEDYYSFFGDESRCDSSGYLSESADPSPAIRRNLNPGIIFKDKRNILSDYNYNSNSAPRRARRSSLIAVVSSSSSTPSIPELIEPSSPPKVKNIACSKQSKKNLKRLKF